MSVLCVCVDKGLTLLTWFQLFNINCNFRRSARLNVWWSKEKIQFQFQIQSKRFVFQTKINKSFKLLCMASTNIGKSSQCWREREREIDICETVSGCQFIVPGIVGTGVANNDDINRILEIPELQSFSYRPKNMPRNAELCSSYQFSFPTIVSP